MTLAVGSGMRLDELIHLQWADIDLERRLIAVHRGRHGTTKSRKARHIPILDTLQPFLRELALKRGGKEFVFPSEDGKPRSKPGVRFPFKQAASRAGLPPQLRINDLRHTFASNWVLDGGDIFRLSKILGHANVTITRKVYAHLAPEAWEQEYHRVSCVVPSAGTVYALTKRSPERPATRQRPRRGCLGYGLARLSIWRARQSSPVARRSASMLTNRDIVSLMQDYIAKHERSPNVIRIARGAEYDLELPDPLKSRAMTDGIRAVLPRIHGMRVEWDAERTEVDYEEPLPPFIKG